MDVAGFVDQYGVAIEASQASLLVGAGLSMGVGYPSWAALLEPVATEMGVPTGITDLPLLAQYIENKENGRESLGQHLATKIGGVEPIPLEHHRLLAYLNVRDTWTTNYDPLIETADDSLTVIETDGDLVTRGDYKRRLYKMHGSIPHGSAAPVGGRDQLVLSREDYDQYDRTHPRLWRLLQAQFLTSSFLFLGFSMTDPNFEAVFKIARLTTSERLMPHYAIMKRSDDDGGLFDHQASNLKRSGVELVEISDYSEITSVLQKLVARTRPSGLFISGSSRTPADPTPPGTDAYPTADTNNTLDQFAIELGKRLAHEEVQSIVAAGHIGAQVGYSFLASLGEYDAKRFLLLRRQSNKEVEPPARRQGRIRFDGEQPNLLREIALERVRAVLIIGGGQGTTEEAQQAFELGMTVIPVSHTGGAAHTIWEEMSDNLDSHTVGQRRIDPEQFQKLGSPDRNVAIQAAIDLVRLGLFLPQDPL